MPDDAAAAGFDTVYQLGLWERGKNASWLKTHNYGPGTGGGSGPGSTPQSTRELCTLLVHLILSLNVRSILDAPCGAMAWMPIALHEAASLLRIDGIVGEHDASVEKRHLTYIGVDVAKSVIDQNVARFGAKSRSFASSWIFLHEDMSTDTFLSRMRQLSQAHDGGSSGSASIQVPLDLVFSRDAFFHMQLEKIHAALSNFCSLVGSGARYLLATHNPLHKGPNTNNATWTAGKTLHAEERAQLPPGFTGKLGEGGFRAVNLHAPPFNLPQPRWQYSETQDRTKMMGLWDLREPWCKTLRSRV